MGFLFKKNEDHMKRENVMSVAFILFFIIRSFIYTTVYASRNTYMPRKLPM
jgi:hypothetical protein